VKYFSRDETEFGAFGDQPSRFGATVAPRQAFAAPAFTLPFVSSSSLVARAATPATALAKAFTTPAAVAAPAVLPSAMKAGGTDARTLDFETGQTTLAPSTAAAPAAVPLTAAQKAARGAAIVNARDTATRNLNMLGLDQKAGTGDSYAEQYAAYIKDATAQSNREAAAMVAADKNQGAWNFKGLDFGLLPAAAKVVVPLIATAATGGLAAPSLAPALKGLSSAVSSAKGTVATGDIKGSVSLIKQADGLITKAQAGVKDAKSTIDATINAALAGYKDAQTGATALLATDAARVAAGTPDGVPLHATAIGTAATSILPRQGFTGSAFPSVVQPAVVARSVPLAPLAKGIAPDDTSIAALQRYTRAALSTDPKYLVLDSGQVLANELAKQVVPGWLVRFDGAVLRQ
jgi:hypothetical protein